MYQTFGAQMMFTEHCSAVVCVSIIERIVRHLMNILEQK